MGFDANVIKRQYGQVGRPASDFRIKANDPLYDSTAGMNDAANSGELVNLPDGIIYSDRVDFGHGSRLRGVGPFRKFRDTYDDDRLKAYTIVRFNGSVTANECLFNLSLKTTLTTDALASDLRDVGFSDLTLDCNGNSIAVGGGRNADGAATVDRGAYFNRCGNNPMLAQNFSILGAARSGLDALAIFSATIRDFAIYECLRHPLRVGYNFENWVTGESIVHGLKMTGMHIRNNGSYLVVGGGDADGVWSKTNYKRGAALFFGGSSCRFADGSFEVNGGPLVYGGAASAGSGGRGSEACVFENWYIEANEAGSLGSGSPDQATGLILALSKYDVGRVTRDLFLNGGNSAGKPQQTVWIRNTDFDNTGIEQTYPGVNAAWGPVNYGEYPVFDNLQSVKGLAATIEIDSDTERYGYCYDRNGATTFTGFIPTGPGRAYGDVTLSLSDGTNSVAAAATCHWFRDGKQFTIMLNQDFTSLATIAALTDLKLTGFPFVASSTKRAFEDINNFRADATVPGDIYLTRPTTTELELWIKTPPAQAVRLQKQKLGSAAQLHGLLSWGLA